MELYVIQPQGTQNITGIVTSVTLSGEYRSCCRTLDFGLLCSQVDPNLTPVTIQLGDHIQINEAGRTMFFGVVWSKSKGTDGNEIQLHCKDFGIYLLKNTGSYRFQDIAPEGIAAKVCGDFGIELGSAAAAGTLIRQNFLRSNLYQIIMTGYTLANDKKYICLFKGKALHILEKGAEQCPDITPKQGLMTSGVAESLDTMVNTVAVYGENDTLISQISSSEDIKRFGKLGGDIKVSRSPSGWQEQGRKALHGVDRKITVTNFGSIEYITGRSVLVTDPFTELKGKFYIDADEHNWKNGIYTNKLTLNFENLMDEMEAGGSGGG